MKRILPFLIVAVVAVATGTGAVLLYRANRPLTLPSRSGMSEAEKSALHVRGKADAPVTLEEYGDYECPPCGKLAEPLKKLESDYADRLRLVFHHFPLVVHAHAQQAACAAEAAALQGRFWEMHDLLYREQAVWSKAPEVDKLFASYAGLLGLDVERFKKDMTGEQVKARIAADQREAAKIGVTGTPTIFVNNRAVPALAGDVSNVRAAIDTALRPKPSS